MNNDYISSKITKGNIVGDNIIEVANGENKERLPDVHPGLPYVRWILDLCERCVSGGEGGRVNL